MNFEIVTDSSCNLTEELIEEYGLHILPLTFMAEGEDTVYTSYLKGRHTDLKQFYTMMREGKTFKTSLPNLADSEKLLRGLLDAGRDVLYIGFSSGLSGTYEATSLLLNSLSSEYPQCKIYHVDTLAASGGQGLLVWEAARMAREGASIEEVHAWVEDNKQKMGHWFTVDDLMHLYHGGRVSRTSAYAGTLLNIKPVLRVDEEGHLIAMEKMRGRKKSLNALVDHMAETALEPVGEQPVYINHADCLEDAEYVAGLIRERWGNQNVIVNYIDPVIGAHTGPGCVALFFPAKGRQ